MNPLLRTFLNYREEAPEAQIFTEKSQTQPDEVLSIRQMLERHVRGLPVTGVNEGVYYPEEVGYVPDLKSLDLTEIEDYRDHYQTESKRIQTELDERTKLEKQAEADEKAIQEEIKQSHLKSKNPPKNPEKD